MKRIMNEIRYAFWWLKFRRRSNLGLLRWNQVMRDTE